MTIKINTTTVTDEQIAKCHRIVDGQTNEVFYMVESEEEKFNEDGSRVEYKVTWDSVKKVFGCTCASGAEGFRSCTFHATCKHCRWAVAAARRYRQEQDALKASYPSEKQMELMARQS